MLKLVLLEASFLTLTVKCIAHVCLDSRLRGKDMHISMWLGEFDFLQ